MQTIYITKVEIANPPLFLKRTFRFASAEDSERFRASIAPDGPVKIVGFNIDHILSPEEALSEITKELEPL